MKNKFLKFKSLAKIKRNRGIFLTRENKIRLDANERISNFDKNFLHIIKKKFLLFTLLLIRKQKKFMIYCLKNINYQDLVS